MVEQQEPRISSSRRCTPYKFCLIVLFMIVGAVFGCFGTWLAIHFLSVADVHRISRTRVPAKPNFIIFLADDTGYGDFQTFGHPTQEWTGVDRMAKEGMVFTSVYSPASICSPSRAALLTGKSCARSVARYGIIIPTNERILDNFELFDRLFARMNVKSDDKSRYPIRAGIFGKAQVFRSLSSGGLPRKEVTIPEALKENGYVTGITGKWHLGINKHNSSDGFHLPMHHGFDVVNTILPYTQNWFCKQHHSYTPEMSNYCFLYKNSEIIEQPINLGSLTSKLLNDTIDFLNNHKDQRFFYLLSFPQTHAALFSDRRFTGMSKRGAYGDNVNEMGWAINEVLDHVIKLGIESNTLALFLSDHGAVRNGCREEGSNGLFRGGKFTTWEGGIRVPAVAWWPGVIKQRRVSHSVLSTLDIFPTFLELANFSRRTPDVWPTLDGISFVHEIIKSKSASHEVEDRPLFFYCSDILTAVRYRNFKLHYYTSNLSNDDIIRENMPHCVFEGPKHLQEFAFRVRCRNNFIKRDPPLVFDVESDSAEHIFIDPESQRYRHVVEEISKLTKTHEASIEPVESEIDKPVLTDLQPCCNPPTCMCNFEE